MQTRSRRRRRLGGRASFRRQYPYNNNRATVFTYFYQLQYHGIFLGHLQFRLSAFYVRKRGRQFHRARSNFLGHLRKCVQRDHGVLKNECGKTVTIRLMFLHCREPTAEVSDYKYTWLDANPPCSFCWDINQCKIGRASSTSSRCKYVSNAYAVISMSTELGSRAHGFSLSLARLTRFHHFFSSVTEITVMVSTWTRNALLHQALTRRGSLQFE